MKSSHAIILFAHGSRDPLWHLPIEAVKTELALRAPDTPVACAYLELCPPDLPTAAADLIQAGADSISIVPLFLGVGKHAREDLPQLLADLRAHYPKTAFHLQKAVGEDPRLIALLATLALERT